MVFGFVILKFRANYFGGGKYGVQGAVKIAYLIGAKVYIGVG